MIFRYLHRRRLRRLFSERMIPLFEKKSEWESFRMLFFDYKPLVGVVEHPEQLDEMLQNIKKMLAESEAKNDGDTSA